MRQKAHSAQRTVSSGTPKNVRKKIYYIYNKYYFYILLLYKVICSLNKLCAVRNQLSHPMKGDVLFCVLILQNNLTPQRKCRTFALSKIRTENGGY